MRLVKLGKTFFHSDYVVSFSTCMFRDPEARDLVFRSTWQIIGSPITNVDVKCSYSLEQIEDAITHAFAIRYLRCHEVFDVRGAMHEALGEWATARATRPHPIRAHVVRFGEGED